MAACGDAASGRCIRCTQLICERHKTRGYPEVPPDWWDTRIPYPDCPSDCLIDERSLRADWIADQSTLCLTCREATLKPSAAYVTRPELEVRTVEDPVASLIALRGHVLNQQ